MRRFVLLLAAAVLLAGCAGYNEIRVEEAGLRSFRFNGTSSATIEINAVVNNPTRYSIAVETVDAVLFRTGKDFVRFSLEDVPSAAPGSVSTVVIPVRASVLDPVGIITAGLDFRSWRIDDFTVSGKVVFSADGRMKKTVRLRKVPLKDIAEKVK